MGPIYLLTSPKVFVGGATVTPSKKRQNRTLWRLWQRKEWSWSSQAVKPAVVGTEGQVSASQAYRQ